MRHRKVVPPLVENSDMEYRDEVLQVLQQPQKGTTLSDKSGIRNDSRKSPIMNLRNGQPYRYMLREFYPSLRKVVCKIEYTVKSFELSEAKNVLKSHPQNLSLNEMYLIANSYEKDQAEFIELFETAVRLFPEDEVANLNAATAALARKDIPNAERYLAKVHTMSAEYNNAMGALLLLKEEYKKAEILLRMAAEAGLEEAKMNIEELTKKQENIEAIKHQKHTNNKKKNN